MRQRKKAFRGRNAFPKTFQTQKPEKNRRKVRKKKIFGHKKRPCRTFLIFSAARRRNGVLRLARRGNPHCGDYRSGLAAGIYSTQTIAVCKIIALGAVEESAWRQGFIPTIFTCLLRLVAAAVGFYHEFYAEIRNRRHYRSQQRSADEKSYSQIDARAHQRLVALL